MAVRTRSTNKSAPSTSLLVPFNKQGDLLHWTHAEPGVAAMSPFGEVLAVWRDNVVFEDTLTFETMSRGRSAADAIWRSQATGVKFSMFLKDLDYLLKTSTIEHGVVSGIWTFCKRGRNYGVMLAQDASNTDSRV